MKRGPNQRIVQGTGDGRWAVRKPGAARASAVTERQSDAIDRAREILRNDRGGELRIKDRHGQFRDSDTVAPGNDPNPPRDRR